MRVGMAQMLVQPGQRDHNLSRAIEMIRGAAAAGCDIVVLPECLDLGWTHDSARSEATAVPGAITDALSFAAVENDILVAAGLTERSGGRIYNAAVLISAQGEILLHHRKISELDFAKNLYSVGSSLAVADTSIGRVGLNICADNSLSSRALGQTLGHMGAQLIVSPCSWAVPPDHDNVADPYGGPWHESYSSLADAFGLAIVGVSNVGPVVGGDWNGWRCIGNSLAIGPDGNVLVKGPYGEQAEELLIATVPLDTSAQPSSPA
ncbi:carbon-nitrogen hydrolase family protein [Agromyces agglutinans]|uniref:carbon-nitrogen hydrolase family protein n=1 Tax=Agromyces agglutinans TaxID=2662258 RepID=UPI001C12AB87|nr:carbon-nitrogen hydrolase family protein [Agromyces agglutinans]